MMPRVAAVLVVIGVFAERLVGAPLERLQRVTLPAYTYSTATEFKRHDVRLGDCLSIATTLSPTISTPLTHASIKKAKENADWTYGHDDSTHFSLSTGQSLSREEESVSLAASLQYGAGFGDLSASTKASSYMFSRQAASSSSLSFVQAVDVAKVDVFAEYFDVRDTLKGDVLAGEYGTHIVNSITYGYSRRFELKYTFRSSDSISRKQRLSELLVETLSAEGQVSEAQQKELLNAARDVSLSVHVRSTGMARSPELEALVDIYEATDVDKLLTRWRALVATDTRVVGELRKELISGTEEIATSGLLPLEYSAIPLSDLDEVRELSSPFSERFQREVLLRKLLAEYTDASALSGRLGFVTSDPGPRGALGPDQVRDFRGLAGILDRHCARIAMLGQSLCRPPEADESSLDTRFREVSANLAHHLQINDLTEADREVLARVAPSLAPDEGVVTRPRFSDIVGLPVPELGVELDAIYCVYQEGWDSKFQRTGGISWELAANSGVELGDERGAPYLETRLNGGIGHQEPDYFGAFLEDHAGEIAGDVQRVRGEHDFGKSNVVGVATGSARIETWENTSDTVTFSATVKIESAETSMSAIAAVGDLTALIDSGQKSAFVVTRKQRMSGLSGATFLSHIAVFRIRPIWGTAD
jgi:hypothetical protein